MTINATGPSKSRAETMSKLPADGMLMLACTVHMFAGALAGDEPDLKALHTRVACVEQANIAQQHQVNNGAPVSHARDTAKPAIELLKDTTHEEQQRMVPGAQAAPARGNPAMETVGAVHRAVDARGQGQGGKQEHAARPV